MTDSNAPQGRFASTRNRRSTGDFKMYLTAEPLSGSTRRPSLCLYYHSNMMVIEVRTNLPSDQEGRDHGLIRAELDPPMFMVFINAMEKVLQEPPTESLHRLRVFRPDFRKVNNGEPVLDSTVAFGKGADGVVYLSVLSSNKERPAIKFPFTYPKWYELWNDQRKPWDPGAFSQIFCKGYLDIWRQLMLQSMHDHYAPKEFKRPDQSGQGQSGQQPSSRGGNDMRTDKPTTDTWAGVDDLPF